ncbi:hypothetical protein NDI76_04785 [Halogeometricum sp. S1BR25-6]|uniref:Uncharacterized protein n=1 Tax=Halogeometricum salsisoli TaxID=2950536 RepID=A0ABU2GB73_9EURY|nr:hypothetical protein [Halogeometricum sp. S1BR25-6]MDS0298050.1 hypothetical protein [Halogeometricum sp. S1BR25-6]
MDADSGDDVWGAGEYKSKSEVEDDAPGSDESSLAALGYGGGEADEEEAATASGTALLTSVLFKVAVTLAVFAAAVLLLVLLWRFI